MPTLRYFEEALSSITQGVLLIDAAQNIVFVNLAFRLMFGVNDELANRGAPVAQLLEFLAKRADWGPVDPDRHLAFLERHISSGTSYHIEKLRGDSQFVSLTGHPIDGRGYVCTVTDITDRQREKERFAIEVAEKTRELRKANRELSRLASVDPLLGIPNRRKFTGLAENVHKKMAQQGRRSVVLMIDVDHFKSINDRHGHTCGDIVLRSIIMVIRSLLKPFDHVVRYGGEEFVVLLPLAELDEGLKLAERICSSVAENPVILLQETIFATVSIGLSTWETEEATIEIALTRADTALYSAKRAGRNQCQLLLCK